ncbi:MAG: carboxypeptidase regulatory-like domain-containing protein [Vicinamibacterales bacterium]
MKAPHVRQALLSLLLLLPGTAFSQNAGSGSIAGIVKDTTGAVLPGVTVEAASPALIEKVRTVVTDDQGNFKIVDLRPGAYTVTFTLPGFSTYRREGIDLPSGFTATANAEMKIGSLEETVTVSGGSPVVDVQRVTQSKVLSRELIDTIPTGRTIQGYAALTVGASVSSRLTDVGGNKGEGYGHIAIHGGRENDGKLNIEGMRYNNMVGTGSGSNRFIMINQAAVQEINMETGGQTAETETAGVVLNIIPKDGGNTFKIYLNTSGATSKFQAKNITDELRARGATLGSSVKKVYDFGAGFGGRIVKDKLWFYTAHRWWGAQNNTNVYYNKLGFNSLRYEPDLTQPGYSDIYQRDNSVRLTYQATARNKLTLHFSKQSNCSCFDGIGTNGRVPEANIDWHYAPVSLTQVTWSFPMTNKLLVEAGYSRIVNWTTALLGPGVSPDAISVNDVGLGLAYNSPPGGTTPAGMLAPNVDYGQHNEKFAVSYVTGSHALKIGAQTHQGRAFFDRAYVNQDLSYTFRNGVPISLSQWATPATSEQTEKINLGIYAQDQWTLRRLTLNLGVRYDHINSYVPAQTRPAGRFVGEINIPEINDVPNWHDITPRFGAAYDVFGNSKTAIKGYLGRYVNAHGVGMAVALNPANAIGLSATRTWADGNANLVPECDLFTNAANGECGALNVATFGRPVVLTRFSDEVSQGWGARDYTWQASLGMQHELRPNMGLNVSYFRTWFGNFTVNDNLAVQPSDFSPYCVTAPTDVRLGSASGTRMCGLYDVNPNVFGRFDGLVKQASGFGKQREYFDGVDITLNTRFGQGGMVQGGVGIGRTVTDNCFVVNSPQQNRDNFCRVSRPWQANTQVKVAVSYPLVLGLLASANLQNLPGFAYSAQYVATNAETLPSLGRNLAAGAAATATVDLLPLNMNYEDRFNQLDLRLTKIFKLGKTRIQAWADLYNTLNTNTVLAQVTTYGPSWRRPTNLLGGRLFKVGGQVDF